MWPCTNCPPTWGGGGGGGGGELYPQRDFTSMASTQTRKFFGRFVMGWLGTSLFAQHSVYGFTELQALPLKIGRGVYVETYVGITCKFMIGL